VLYITVGAYDSAFPVGDRRFFEQRKRFSNETLSKFAAQAHEDVEIVADASSERIVNDAASHDASDGRHGRESTLLENNVTNCNKSTHVHWFGIPPDRDVLPDPIRPSATCFCAASPTSESRREKDDP
jgi:hypothetical protein